MRIPTVSVIDTMTNTVTTTILVDRNPFGVAVTSDGSRVYVIDTATSTVKETIAVGAGPVAFGVFIQPPPKFAGTPGYSNCYGKSTSALTQQYGGLGNAAAAL